MSKYKYLNIRNSFHMRSDMLMCRDALIPKDTVKYYDYYSMREEEEKLTKLPSFIGYDIIPIREPGAISRSIHGKVKICNIMDRRPIRGSYSRRDHDFHNKRTTIARPREVSNMKTFMYLNDL